MRSQAKYHTRPKRPDQIKAYTTVAAVLELYCKENEIKSSRKDKRAIGKLVKTAFKGSNSFSIKDLVYFVQFEQHQNASKLHRVNAYPIAFLTTIKNIIMNHFNAKSK